MARPGIEPNPPARATKASRQGSIPGRVTENTRKTVLASFGLSVDR